MAENQGQKEEQRHLKNCQERQEQGREDKLEQGQRGVIKQRVTTFQTLTFYMYTAAQHVTS